jgi:REP element-mobilizing transposase RayT
MVIKNPNKKYHTKESKVFSCQYYCIYTPKYRRRVLVNGVEDQKKI